MRRHATEAKQSTFGHVFQFDMRDEDHNVVGVLYRIVFNNSVCDVGVSMGASHTRSSSLITDPVQSFNLLMQEGGFAS